MKKFVFTVLLLAAAGLGLHAGDRSWPPTPVEVEGRQTEVFRHGSQPAWGYAKPQADSFVVVHPKTPQAQAPLYVVLHSAGHSVWTAVECTREVGNHDIYRSPDGFYALYLDCRANMTQDWWWGGLNPKVAGTVEKNGGGEPGPTEKRVMDTVRWVMKKYDINPDRVYLCGNSMGGSGALGIGMRNGDLFAAMKVNVPAGIDHVSDRMYFPPAAVPAEVVLPDPPVVIDYSGQDDHWSAGHERFVQAMNDRKYPLYFYWGPFGHGNNHARIMEVNDLINSFDWLAVRKNEAYAVFSNASCNDELPWPDRLDDKSSGQVNAFFRWKNLVDRADRFEISLYLVTAEQLDTRFALPSKATADVSLRRVQQLQVAPGHMVRWSYGDLNGQVQADRAGVITIPGLEITSTPVSLILDIGR